MKDLTNLKTDFRDWLTLPITKTFTQLLLAEQEKLLDWANQSTFHNYHKKELPPEVVSIYGKVDGIASVLSMMEQCKEEAPITTVIDDEEVLTYPTIDDLFQQAFEPKNV